MNERILWNEPEFFTFCAAYVTYNRILQSQPWEARYVKEALYKRLL
jgi:hypothetical protein